MVNCEIRDEEVDLTGLTPQQAQYINIALLHFKKRNLPIGSEMWIEEPQSVTKMIDLLDKIQDDLCRNLEAKLSKTPQKVFDFELVKYQSL